MAAPTRLDIIIIGAGLSGLAAAISCALGGHKVLVLEAAKELGEIGAGLQVTPNGTLILKQLGIYNRLAPHAAEPTLLQVRRYSDGKPLTRTENFDQEMREKYGTPFWDLHRVDVQRALLDRAKELGAVIRAGAKVKDVDFDSATLTLENGDEKLSADLLVGADGLWSRCRECFLTSTTGKPDAPLPTGDLAYRIVLRLSDLNDPELRAWIAKPTCQFWIGPNSHVVAYSLRNGTEFNLVLLVPDDLPADVARQPGNIEEMRALFANWDPVLNRFLDQVKGVDKWKLMHRPELESWVGGGGRFVFVGDACHAMLPYLAQGANSSLEDGAVLGYILSSPTLTSKSQLSTALRLYERLRKPRSEIIARESFAQRQDFHRPDGPEQRARDELMLRRLGGEAVEIGGKFPSRWQDEAFQRWLYGYDAKREAEEGLRRWPIGGEG